MRFLLVAKQQRNASAFLSTLQHLVARGHDVTVAVQERDDARDRRLAQQVDSERFRVVPCPAARIDEWGAVAPVERRLRDCLHILQPQFSGAATLQLRIFDKLRQELGLGASPEELLAALRVLPATQMSRVESVLRLAESSIPTSPLFDEFLASHKPDVLLVSPLVHFGSAQADVAASARRLNIPLWMLLFSWDNLSTKGCMHVEPDLMFVWNERQRAEAVELHRFPASRVVVIGAARFDEFFELRPTLAREEFHTPLGLDASRPTLLYLCSSRLIAPDELPFIRRWLATIRASTSDVLRGCNIVVRPHPDIAPLSEGVVFERHTWAKCPDLDAHVARPFDDARAVVLRTSYKDPTGLYESLWHSTAVIGLNTTAELEAGIAGRPVFTIQPDAEGEGPRATVHFHYLTRENGGFVSAASSMEQHRQQLENVLAGDVDPAPIRSFIESFLRPLGIDRPVSPLLADALVEHLDSPRAAVASAAPAVTFDPRPLSAAVDVVPLSYTGARIFVRATPETLRQVDGDSVRIDRATVKWLERRVKIGEVVYDVNAGFGPYVLVAARERGAVVVAFEPGYNAYAALCDNVLLNGCQGSVIPIPLAIASRDAVANIKYGRGNAGAEHHSIQWTRWRVKSAEAVESHVHPVIATKLDTAVERYGLPAPHHIRISAGGTAADVIRGAERTLGLPSLRTVWLQVATDEQDDIVRALAAYGLHVAVRRERRNSVQIIFSRQEADERSASSRGREEIPAQ
jgi:FkbM family methyltransferase